MDTPSVPEGTGGLLTQKAGPLPMWGWGIVVLGAAYGVKLYKGRKSAADTTTTPAAGYDSAMLPSNIQPQYTTVEEGGSQSYVNSPVTTVGRQYVDTGAIGVVNGAAPPKDDDDDTPPPSAPPAKPPKPKDPPKPPKPPKPAPAPKPPAPPKPTPQPVHVPAPPAPAGKWVTTVKYTGDHNAPYTLTGLALQAYGNASLWQKIWNAPQNADLVRRRGSPTKIQPGDRFWAPA